MLVNTLRGHKRGVWAAQFSPVDQAVATASGDKTLRLWALADGTCLKTFEGHTASVLRLNFLSAGTQVPPHLHIMPEDESLETKFCLLTPRHAFPHAQSLLVYCCCTANTVGWHLVTCPHALYLVTAFQSCSDDL